MEICIFLFAYTVFSLFSKHNYTYYNNYSYLANAWLNGRLDAPELPDYLESIRFRGYTYVHFAPGPALLCLPFVAVFGMNGFNAGWLCLVLGAANAVLIYRILGNLKLGDEYGRLWMTALFVFGTVHFWCASWGTSWLLGHLSTIFFWGLAMYFLTLPVEECPWYQDFLSGLFFGLAVTCRLTALLGGIYFAGYLLMNRKHRIVSCLRFAGGAAIFGGLYMLYNYVRFGTIMDSSYGLTYLKDYHTDAYNTMQALPAEEQAERFRELQRSCGGPLQFGFIPYNLYSLFLMLPDFYKSFPFAVPTQAGVCITLISPALFFAFAAEWKKPMTWILWATVLATSVPFLMNYGNGMSQFGMRYSLDFTPYLFLLACMGLREMKLWKKGLVVWCILANAWGALFWKCFY